MRAALRAHAVTVTGDMKILELGDFIGDAVGTGALPVELGRHDSQPLADIVIRDNKWSVNWLGSSHHARHSIWKAPRQSGMATMCAS